VENLVYLNYVFTLVVKSLQIYLFEGVKLIHLSPHSDGIWAGRPGLDSQQCKICLLSTVSGLKLGPTRLYLRANHQWLQADNSPQFIVEVKKGRAISPLPHMSYIIVLN
jgi:hypothetical protein